MAAFDPVKKIVSALDSVGGNRGTSPSVANISATAKKLRASSRDLDADFNFLIKHNTLASLKLALSLVPTSDSLQPNYDQVLTLANHSNWEIREYAAEALANLMECHFENVFSRLTQLRSSPSENVRRAVVVAMKYLAKRRDAKRLPMIIDILEQYMNDSSAYVKKNLGPFALGDALINYGPEEVIDLVRRSSKDEDANSRWNAAATFTAAAASKHYPKVARIFPRLLKDKDRQVRTAALKALTVVAKRHPEWRHQIRMILTHDNAVQRPNSLSLARAIEACDA